MTFNVDDVVQYVVGVDRWVQMKYKFKVVSVPSSSEIQITPLQDIYDMSSKLYWSVGDNLILEKYKFYKFKKIIGNKNNKPEWF